MLTLEMARQVVSRTTHIEKGELRVTHENAILTNVTDHFYTNNLPHQATSHILLDDISDHMPILMLLNNIEYKSKESNIYIRDTKNFNTENFLIELTKEYHNVRYEVNLTINDRFNRFIEIFSVTLCRHAPFKLASKKTKFKGKTLDHKRNSKIK